MGTAFTGVHTLSYTVKNKPIKNSISELPPEKKKNPGPSCYTAKSFHCEMWEAPRKSIRTTNCNFCSYGFYFLSSSWTLTFPPEKTYSNEEKRRRDFRNYVGWTRGSSVLTWRVSGPRFSPQSWKKETRKALKGASRAMVRKGTNHIQVVCVLHGLYIQTILIWNRNLLHFYKLEQNQSATRQTKLFVIPPRNKPSKKKCKTSALKIRVITKRNWGRPKYRIQESRPVSVDWKPC